MLESKSVTKIHPTAVVSPEAKLGHDVEIGPLCVVEAGAEIGDGCILGSHSVLKSGVCMGASNVVHDHAVLGGRPQYLQCGETTGRLLLGEGNTIREGATLHVALKEDACTVIGDDNYVMINSHIAHDCQIGNHTIIANNVMLAGHVTIEDYAYLSGAVGIHQFCRVGMHAMVGGQTRLTKDAPPFVTIDGKSNLVMGLNRVGLRRRGFERTEISQLKEAYQLIFRSDLSFQEILQSLQETYQTGPAMEFHRFLARCERGFVHERRGPRKPTLKISQDDHATEQIRKAG